jgi:hypothetical protein
MKNSKDGSKYRFAILSLQFVELNLAYRQRLGAFVKEVEQ